MSVASLLRTYPSPVAKPRDLRLSCCTFYRPQYSLLPAPYSTANDDLQQTMSAAAAVDQADIDDAERTSPPAKRPRVEPDGSTEARADMEKTAAAAAAAHEQDNIVFDDTEGTPLEERPLGADAAPEASTSKASSDRKGKGKDKFVPVHGGWTSTP